MSGLHGSELPSLRRASATSLLKTDRFWVNLGKEKERLRELARQRLFEPLLDDAPDFSTTERAPDPG